LKFEVSTLHKKEEIWYYLGDSYQRQSAEEERRQCMEENERLKSQIYLMVKEMEQKGSLIQ
jgi:hypothetical protein